jgi:hypothetical protein
MPINCHIPKIALLLPLLATGLWGWADQAEAAVETWELVAGKVPAAGFVVDMQNRLEVLYFYNAVFAASEGAESRIGWTSSYGNCVAGQTAAEFRTDVQRRVNYYRALCGLPADITFDAEPAFNDPASGSPQVPANASKQACAQAAAYNNAFSDLFFDNYEPSHNPTPDTTACYSPMTWNGAAYSNLTLGYFGPQAVDAYIAEDVDGDTTSNNSNVGHRRLLLYSRARDMSTGDVPPGIYDDGTGTYQVPPANALYVAGLLKPAATAPKQFVTWPPGGYLPIKHNLLRWSISYPGAVFPTTAAAISMTGPGGTVIPVTLLSANQSNQGDNTLVFQPQLPPVTGSADVSYRVTVSGITGPGVPATYTWQTTFFDPAALGMLLSITGPAQPSAAGADYGFTPVPFAASYQVLVNQAASAASGYLENGDGGSPDITTDKTGTYPILQGAATLTVDGKTSTFTPRSGSKSFHLCFPLDQSEADYQPHYQSFLLGPEFIPSAASTISFNEYFRWLFTVNRLSLEITTDGGSLWTEIYGRNGASTYSVNGSYSSTAWDSSWKARSVSLAGWSGKPVRLRFILRHGNLSFDGPDINHGCFIDDISLTHVSRLGAAKTSTVAGPAFRLDSQTAGAPLIPGASYTLRVRPRIGAGFLGYSTPLSVVAKPPTGFESAYPLLAAQPLGDADQDGVSNFIEYAFGLNPGNPSDGAGLPQPALTSSGLTLSFLVPAGITDVIYTAERTSGFVQWAPVPDQGTGAQHRFTIPVNPGTKSFIRLRVSQSPP